MWEAETTRTTELESETTNTTDSLIAFTFQQTHTEFRFVVFFHAGVTLAEEIIAKIKTRGHESIMVALWVKGGNPVYQARDFILVVFLVLQGGLDDPNHLLLAFPSRSDKDSLTHEVEYVGAETHAGYVDSTTHRHEPHSLSFLLAIDIVT